MNGPGAPGITRIRQAYPAESERIINGDGWEHGFWAGTLSFARLINELAVTNDTVRDHVDMDSDEEPMTAAELRASAHEDYPMLES